MKANLLIFLSILLGSGGQVLMKIGTMRVVITEQTVVLTLLAYLTNPWVFGGLALYGLSAVIWILALSKVELSYAYPLVASSYIFVSILAYFLLNEPFSLMRGVGLVVICLGVVIIANT